MRITRVASLVYASALFVAVTPTYASLALTQTGIADGFTLSTFLSGYNAQYGPLAQGILSNGNVVTGSLLNRQIYVFTDTDGQTLANAVSSKPYTCETSNCNFAMATAGGQVYGAQAFGGVYYQFANDGSFSPLATLQASGLRGYLGMWPDPANGHIIAASSRGLVEIDPVAQTFRVINANLFPDGVTVSPDGSTAYVAINGGVQSYSIATGALIRSFATGHSPDGMGVISGGLFTGDYIVNNNDGTVGLLDPGKPNGDPGLFTIIASGGTRGDFVSPDVNNGTLFLSQDEQVARLSCGPGCSIGVTPPPPSTVPEPGTMGLLGAGWIAVMAVRRRRAS